MAAPAHALAEETSGKSLLLDLDGIVLRASAKAVEELELSESDIIGQPVAILLQKPGKSELKRALERAQKGAFVSLPARFARGKAAGLAARLSLKLKIAGSLCALEAGWEAQAQVKAHSPAADDSVFTRQKTFESLLQAYLELQQINKRKMAMLAAATHELKTPLAVINGACELLLGGKLNKLPPTEHGIVTLAYQNCRRLLNVVNSFLDYTALEQGKMILRRESRSVSVLVNEVANYWKRLAQSRNIEFRTKVDEQLPPVICDPRKVQNVLDNLCDNAVKFTPAGGWVTLAADLHFWDRRRAIASNRAEERRSACVQSENAVKFIVSDSGPGIPPEFHQEIFEQYFQVPGRTSGGMGLGLAIAWEIVAAHKGKIWVESQPGQGSIFSFLLPL